MHNGLFVKRYFWPTSHDATMTNVCMQFTRDTSFVPQKFVLKEEEQWKLYTPCSKAADELKSKKKKKNL